MTASAPPAERADGRDGAGAAARPNRPLVITGAIGACAAAGSGLVFITLLVWRAGSPRRTRVSG